jgi:hypothetical protein
MVGWSRLKELRPILDRGYEELGYREEGDRGYRFLSSPESTLYSGRLILSINPAGNTPDYENDALFTEEGKSSFFDERWLSAPVGSSKLQVQLQALFEFLNWDPLATLQAPFSPYRHPSWSAMPRELQERTIDFCVAEIWRPYFERHIPKQIVCVGKPQLEPLLRALDLEVLSCKSVFTGWNNNACRYAEQIVLAEGVKIVQIPHLSRFGIMTSGACHDHLPEIFSVLL